MFNYVSASEDQVEYVTVGKITDFTQGWRWLFEIDGQPIALLRIGGAWYAIADVCTHDEGPLGEGDLDGFEIECPRHGARFDVRSGKVLHLPAVVDIPAYPVREVKGELQIGLPKR
jgi:3-phenylpropionate/trans-cinnamate dioxygenase ferredoxin subunit